MKSEEIIVLWSAIARTYAYFGPGELGAVTDVESNGVFSLLGKLSKIIVSEGFSMSQNKKYIKIPLLKSEYSAVCSFLLEGSGDGNTPYIPELQERTDLLYQRISK